MGPLKGYRVIEMAGIGPAPFACMLLADMGAEIIRVDRQDAADLGIPGRATKFNVLERGRRSIKVDLKSEAGRAVARRLIAKADALVEGFRPGVLERLGLAPDDLMKINPTLGSGRMTGFGQDGPMAPRAGHDINYIAMAGVLHTIGRRGEAPVPPLNLVGDFGGGGMFMAFGVVCALLEAVKSGKGQVVDATMIDGAAYLAGFVFAMHSAGTWKDERGSNVLDTGAPWYDVYPTKDGKWLSVGAIEARFYAEFVAGIGLDMAELPKQHDRAGWPDLRRLFAAKIAAKTRAEWEQVFAASDACVAPVLSLAEVSKHPHNETRGTFLNRDGVVQPAPAPRFSRTKAEAGSTPVAAGSNTDAILAEFGFSAVEAKALSAAGTVGGRSRT